jgi:hypothetical protein
MISPSEATDSPAAKDAEANMKRSSRRSRPFAVSQEQAPGTALYKCQPLTSWQACQRKQGLRHVETDIYSVVELPAVAVFVAPAHALLQLVSNPAAKVAGPSTSFAGYVNET